MRQGMVNTDRGVEDIPTDRKPDIDDRGGGERPSRSSEAPLPPKEVLATVVRLQIENRKRDGRDLTDLLLFRGLGEFGVTGISFRSLRIKGRGVPVAEGAFQRDAAW